MRRYVSDEDCELLSQIGDVMRALPEIDLGRTEEGRPILVSCHMLCRAFAAVFSRLECKDGYVYLVGYSWIQHSWLRLGKRIVDPYPVGILAFGAGPLMFETGFSLPWEHLYHEAP